MHHGLKTCPHAGVFIHCIVVSQKPFGRHKRRKKFAMRPPDNQSCLHGNRHGVVYKGSAYKLLMNLPQVLSSMTKFICNLIRSYLNIGPHLSKHIGSGNRGRVNTDRLKAGLERACKQTRNLSSDTSS
eukprot:6208988-Pleurochrysis_carterae.AAC.2